MSSLLFHTLNALALGDPERAHTIARKIARTAQASPLLLDMIGMWYGAKRNPRPVRLFGLTFPNPIGLAAGFDKQGEMLPLLQALGFGFVEVGTILPQPQPGNPRPRMFRVPGQEALINRMGFNSNGAPEIAMDLWRSHKGIRIPVGLNVSRMKNTPLEETVGDAIAALTWTHSSGDYVVLNISSPNTPNLRDLQTAQEKLGAMLRALQSWIGETTQTAGAARKPLLVKIAPDLSDKAMEALVATFEGAQVDGIICFNTTLERESLGVTGQVAKEAGGLSGDPLFPLAYKKFLALRRMTKLPLIYAGGLTNAARVRMVLDEGAQLVQILTGFVYQGPRLVNQARRIAM